MGFFGKAGPVIGAAPSRSGAESAAERAANAALKSGNGRRWGYPWITVWH